MKRIALISLGGTTAADRQHDPANLGTLKAVVGQAAFRNPDRV